jgi:hypothetical protein
MRARWTAAGVAVLWLVAVCDPAGARDDVRDVKQTVLTYVEAAATGDFETLDRLSTGLARDYRYQPATARFRFHQAFARTFRSLGRVRIMRDVARVEVTFHVRALTRVMLNAARERLTRRHVNPRTRAAVERRIRSWAPQQARLLSRIWVWLVRQEGRWLIHRIAPVNNPRRRR